MKILVETSARHVHVSKEDFEVLFGKNEELTVKKPLSQPGQFASFQKVDIVGPRGEIKGVSILGPMRAKTQVELSFTDARKLGINAPIRDSGNLENTPGCEIIGPNGTLKLYQGVIIAQRHMHLHENDSKKYNLNDKDTVSVAIKTDYRSLIFENVLVRVSSDFSAAVHIDTDESNAAGVVCTTYGEIIK